jgi:Phage portal protein
MADIINKAVSKLGAGISGAFFSKQKKAIAISRRGTDRGFMPGVSGDVKKVGYGKPSKVSFDQLKLIAASDTIIRICINTIKKAVSQAEWNIIPKRQNINDYSTEHIEKATMFFELVNSQGENLRTLLDMSVEDILTIDAGVIEKVFNADGELTELNAVDGSTIRPVINKFGDLGGYVQMINTKIVARFAPNEIIYIMQNPQNDIRNFGYGKSPIEEILMTVQASLNADVYNAQIFSKDNIPPGLLDLGNMGNDEAQNFMALWNATVVTNTQKLKFIWGSDNPKKFTSFNQTNKDMQYMDYIDWLSRLKLATYGLTSQDANITQDVNRATAQVQAAITNARGVSNMLTLIEEYINREIMIPQGYDDVVFKFKRETDVQSKKTQAEIDKIYIETGVVSPSDVAKREGIDSFSEEDIDEENGLDGGRSPNPEDNEIDKPKPDKEDVLEQDDTKKRKKSTYFKPLYK